MTWRVHKKRCARCKAPVELAATTVERWLSMSYQEREEFTNCAARAEVLCADCDPDAAWRSAHRPSKYVEHSVKAKAASKQRDEASRAAAGAVDVSSADDRIKTLPG